MAWIHLTENQLKSCSPSCNNLINILHPNLWRPECGRACGWMGGQAGGVGVEWEAVVLVRKQGMKRCVVRLYYSQIHAIITLAGSQSVFQACGSIDEIILPLSWRSIVVTWRVVGEGYAVHEKLLGYLRDSQLQGKCKCVVLEAVLFSADGEVIVSCFSPPTSVLRNCLEWLSWQPDASSCSPSHLNYLAAAHTTLITAARRPLPYQANHYYNYFLCLTPGLKENIDLIIT